MKALSLVLTLVFCSLSLFAREGDHGWKRLDFYSAETTHFWLDINLKGYQASPGIIYSSEIWVHVSDYMISSAKARIYNYDELHNLKEVKEFPLSHNNEAHVFEASYPYGLALGLSRSPRPSDVSLNQEIEIEIDGLNGHQILKVSGDNTRFGFNILNLFGIRP